MRIALVTDYYLPTLGGVQTAVKAQRAALLAAGHEATVFCPGDPRAPREGVVPLPVSPVFRPDGYPFTWPPRRTIQQLERALAGFDVVHVHSEMFAALSAIVAARRAGLPVVYTVHGRVDVYTQQVLPVPSLSSLLLAALHRRFVSDRGIVPRPSAYTATRTARRMWRVMLAQARASDHVVSPSQHVADRLLAQGMSTPLSVVPNELEHEVAVRIGRPAVRRPAPDVPLRALWVGRLSPEKRPEVFAQAVRLAGSGIEAHLYGDGISRRRVGRAGYPVHLHGAVPQAEVLDAMRQAHVVVSSSFDFDNQPMVIVEAIASGLPVVYCDPDLAGLIPAGGGFCTPTPDATGLAATLRMLRDDPGQVERASRALIAQRTGQPATAPALLAVYQAAIAAAETRLPRG